MSPVCQACSQTDRSCTCNLGMRLPQLGLVVFTSYLFPSSKNNRAALLFTENAVCKVDFGLHVHVERSCIRNLEVKTQQLAQRRYMYAMLYTAL